MKSKFLESARDGQIPLKNKEIVGLTLGDKVPIVQNDRDIGESQYSLFSRQKEDWNEKVIEPFSAATIEDVEQHPMRSIMPRNMNQSDTKLSSRKYSL